jgi:hypothetical protein
MMDLWNIINDDDDDDDEYGRLSRPRADLDAVEKSWVPNNNSSGLQPVT